MCILKNFESKKIMEHDFLNSIWNVSCKQLLNLSFIYNIQCRQVMSEMLVWLLLQKVIS